MICFLSFSLFNFDSRKSSATGSRMRNGKLFVECFFFFYFFFLSFPYIPFSSDNDWAIKVKLGVLGDLTNVSVCINHDERDRFFFFLSFCYNVFSSSSFL